MNSLGSGLVWCGAQVSLSVFIGGMFYLLVRRRGPAAGSLAALGVLVTVIALSLAALSPWPTWWRLPIAPSAASRTASATVNAGAAQSVAPHMTTGATAVSPNRSADGAATGFDAAMWAHTFWTSFWDGLGNQPLPEKQPAWRWTAFAAWLLLAGIALGIGRLILGLAAVRQYRRRTRPVTDAELNALVNATRAQLGCDRAIELRESSEIISPATVGWRRPLILLPIEWREWSDAERQVVLAHEVAHVRRGDFLAALVAQISVALHFYNPLVHWLGRQLRVEQELAADAWGATAAGGSTPYLTALAAMALRQDDRTPLGRRGRSSPPAEHF